MGIPTKLSESYVGQLVERVADLKAENQRLREALRPFVKAWDENGRRRIYSDTSLDFIGIPSIAYVAAAEALKEESNAATKD